MFKLDVNRHEFLRLHGPSQVLPGQSCSQVPPIRSRREVWIGSPDCDSIREDRLRANLYPEPLPERHRRALGGKLPPRAARPRYWSERAAFEATCFRLHLLLSRGPNTSRAAQANPGGQKLCCRAWSGDLSATLGWVAPPLPSRCLSSTVRQATFLELSRGSACAAFSRCEEIQQDLNVSTTQLATETLWGMHRSWCVSSCGERQLVSSYKTHQLLTGNAD